MPNVENVGAIDSESFRELTSIVCPMITHPAGGSVNRPYLAAVQLGKFAPDFPLPLR